MERRGEDDKIRNSLKNSSVYWNAFFLYSIWFHFIHIKSTSLAALRSWQRFYLINSSESDRNSIKVFCCHFLFSLKCDYTPRRIFIPAYDDRHLSRNSKKKLDCCWNYQIRWKKKNKSAIRLPTNDTNSLMSTVRWIHNQV